MAAIVPNKFANYRFLQFWILANYQSVRNLAGGDLRDGLNLQHIGSIGVPIPPITEQQAIACFLDHETAEIDEFIADQQQLIRLLNERRAATITQAVTRGLDDRVSVEYGGIDWLGKIPQHWTRSTLSRLGMSQESGTSVNGYGDPAEDETIGVLRTSCVSKGYFDSRENKTVVTDDIPRVSCLVRKGALIVNRANTPSLVGSVGYVDSTHSNLYLSDKLWQIDFSLAHNRFIYWWSKSPAYKAQLQFHRVGVSVSMQNLSFADFRHFDIALPSVAEQQNIVDYLDLETAEIDATIADAKEAIELSKERRAALISAAVTGKIDVRDHPAAKGAA